ncbi:MAG: class I SAM-dependent methyltransferase [Candidatus Sumerlaeia bacterium]|nr:class I SAM-dependent methyltransferase [Candidatus Sumerlaeia bacterium]
MTGVESTGRWARNRRHWEVTLDAQNLTRDGQPAALDRQISLFETADVVWAMDQLEPLAGARVLDIGGGLALAAVLFCRRGARVTIADISLPRLQRARANLERLGLADRVDLVVASAEHLPFADASLDRLFSKSVLIHTRLGESAAECARVLRPEGRAAFIEPMRRNPFVNLYRRLAAPAIWREITTYFGPGEFRTLAHPFRAATRQPPRRRLGFRAFHFLGFFAGVFQFLVPLPAAFRIAEGVLLRLDRILFALLPGLRRRAWFGVLAVGPAGGGKSVADCPGGRRR